MTSKAMLGAEGTEQFSVTTRVDGNQIRSQAVHDPFVNTTAVVRLHRMTALWYAIFPHDITVQVVVRGSEGAQRAIMTLDPNVLRIQTEMIREERAKPLRYDDCCSADRLRHWSTGGLCD